MHELVFQSHSETAGFLILQSKTASRIYLICILKEISWSKTTPLLSVNWDQGNAIQSIGLDTIF